MQNILAGNSTGKQAFSSLAVRACALARVYTESSQIRTEKRKTSEEKQVRKKWGRTGNQNKLTLEM